MILLACDVKNHKNRQNDRLSTLFINTYVFNHSYVLYHYSITSYLHFTELWSQGQECQSIRILPAFWKSFSAATACGQQIADISSKAKAGWKFCHHIFEACRDARMVLSAHCFLARLIHPKDSNQFFMKLPFQIFKPFDSAPSANFANFGFSDHSAGFRAERAAHLSHGNSIIGPCKTAKGNIRSKMVKRFQGLCCTASSSAMLHACKRESRFWNHERYLRTGLMISLLRAIKTWGYKDGNLKQKSSNFILISAKVPWPALCQCRIRPWQQFYPWQFSHLYRNSGPHKRHLSAYDEIPSQIGNECIRRLLLECKCRLCMLLQHSFDGVCHLLQRHANQAGAMCSSQAGFVFMSKSVCMNAWTCKICTCTISDWPRNSPFTKGSLCSTFLLCSACIWLHGMQEVTISHHLASWDSTALHIAEAKFNWKMLKALWYWRLALASPISWRFCLSISVRNSVGFSWRRWRLGL